MPNAPDSIEALRQLVLHEFPQSQVYTSPDGEVSLVTVHSTGKTVEEALRSALKTYSVMKDDGLHVRQMLDDVNEDLKQHGMSRERHDSLLELLSIAENSINGGVITQVIPWIEVPSLNREIEELRRRISTRLMMVAQEMKDHENAKKKAAHKSPRVSAERLEAVRGMSLMQKLLNQ